MERGEAWTTAMAQLLTSEILPECLHVRLPASSHVSFRGFMQMNPQREARGA